MITFATRMLLLWTISTRVLSAILPQSLGTTSTTPLAQESASNVSADNILQISCNAPLYGQNLRVPSCKSVFNVLPRDTKQLVFAERTSMVAYDVPLPNRLQSKDGFCYVQAVLARDAQSGRASPFEIGTAAMTLFQQCVRKYGYGGEASEIGGDNNLNVVISSYKPHVICKQRPAPPWKSAIKIFADMSASKDLVVFGHAGAPGVQFTLPYTFNAIDARAMIKVDSDGRSATASWYEIWEAVNAVAYMCVKAYNKEGRATGIGSLGNIRVDLLDEHPDLRQTATNPENESSLVDSLLPIDRPIGFAGGITLQHPASNVTVVEANVSSTRSADTMSAGTLEVGTA